MICKECGKNNAEFYYKHTVNGKTLEYALCSRCAEKLKKEGKLNAKLPLVFDDFGFGLSADALYNMNDFLGLQSSGKRIEKKKCTFCASTYDDLVKTGRVGCAKCYEVFSAELNRSLENIHGKAKYVGKRPKRVKAKDTKQDKLRELKSELERVIREQEFERAAVLRDEIRKIEGETEAN